MFSLSRFAIMQGRLSPMINNMIQSFPFGYWEKEIDLVKKLNLSKLEWTVDQFLIDSNPINTLTKKNFKKILNSNGIKVNSLTGDFIMQSPYYKCKNNLVDTLHFQFLKILKNMNKFGIKIFVFPIVDNGYPSNSIEINNLINFFKIYEKDIKRLNLIFAFESGFSPIKTIKLLNKLNKYGDYFYLNYDIGNSASMGFDPSEEFDYYNEYIKNIHIKDRKYRGPTVPLGRGDVDFKLLIKQFEKYDYNYDFTFQVSRARNHKHIERIKDSITFLKKVKFIN